MAILFYLQSKKNPAPIYIRIRSGRDIDAKARTKFSINPILFAKGKTKRIKEVPGSDATAKKQIQEQNKQLIDLDKSLSELSNHVTNLLNLKQDFEVIDTNWLKQVINPKEEKIAPSRLVDYFDYYIECKKNDITESTAKKLRVFKNRITKYEETAKPVYIENVNLRFVVLFEAWLREKNYAKNTIIKTIKTIKELSNHAKIHGIKIHSELEQVARGKDYRYVRSEHIFLTLDEIQQVKNVAIADEELDRARDWLVISCYTAQRVSDFLRFRVEEIVDIDGYKFIDFRQEKTDDPLYIMLRKPVLDIIEKRNGNFPATFSHEKNSNSTIYNRLIKLVCKAAGIKQTVTVSMKNPKTNRHETQIVPKYKAVTSHIGRRSFATNFYTQIDTTLLMSQTGHKSEKVFLDYVGKNDKSNAVSLARSFEKLEAQSKNVAPMKILKNF